MRKTEIAELLEALGYQVAFREDTWTQCMVWTDQERWMGTGADEPHALRDAVDQMFPSAGARYLLGTALEADDTELPERGEAAPPEPRSAQPVREEEPASPIADVSVSETEAAPEQAWETYVSPDEPFLAEPEPEPEDKMTVAEALAGVRAIEDEIHDAIPDLAMMAAYHQRLNFSAWIFRARALQEMFPTDEVVEEAVHQVALRLTNLCKIYWPGSVLALQIYTVPPQAFDGLMRTRRVPLRWADTVDIIEEEIERVEADRRTDAYGWQDKARCLPAPRDPRGVLREAGELVEKIMGPLGGPLDEIEKGCPARRVAEQMESLVRAAHLLRWVRPTCLDPERWGLVMGALRWASRHAQGEGDGLKELLQPEHVPRKPWAQLLGRDPAENRRAHLQKKVLGTLPSSDVLEEDLLLWLQDAFKVFNNPQIAKLASGCRDRILELANTDFADADRSARSRLRKLQGIFRTQASVDDVHIPDVSEEADDWGDESPEDTVDPAVVLRDRVRTVTEGKRILFVTNRDDRRLERDLETDLLADVTLKNGGNSRQMGAIVDAVSGSRYDLVLMATGFNNHSADANLCRAAKNEGIPYIRVQKGRRGATLRALSRAFNLSVERKAADESAATAPS